MAAIQGLCISLNLFVAVATEPAWDWPQALDLILVLWPDQLRWNGGRGLPAPVGQLGDKADLTPSPLLGSGSNRGCLTGETYDVVRSYGICSYRAGFSHPPYAPSKPLQPRRENGAERNRTAVRNTGVDHLVRSRTDLIILASRPKTAMNLRRGKRTSASTKWHINRADAKKQTIITSAGPFQGRIHQHKVND